MALSSFRRACDCGRGAAFFSVARGKVATLRRPPPPPAPRTHALRTPPPLCCCRCDAGGPGGGAVLGRWRRASTSTATTGAPWSCSASPTRCTRDHSREGLRPPGPSHRHRPRRPRLCHREPTREPAKPCCRASGRRQLVGAAEGQDTLQAGVRGVGAGAGGAVHAVEDTAGAAGVPAGVFPDPGVGLPGLRRGAAGRPVCRPRHPLQGAAPTPPPPPPRARARAPPHHCAACCACSSQQLCRPHPQHAAALSAPGIPGGRSDDGGVLPWRAVGLRADGVCGQPLPAP